MMLGLRAAAGSPDLKAAKKVADFLGTDHHEFTFTVQVRGVFNFIRLPC